LAQLKQNIEELNRKIANKNNFLIKVEKESKEVEARNDGLLVQIK
jgi:hypothetical protein